ncbi:PD40 domain-containing protein [Solirubrobacter sp. CPCC 204708]|uniref:PD40 domain-containing protein n=1 Tax=Solirubrobacter deserti TaxID=2282478 RepID=A0ABT4RGJ6_9ACTN|nr:Calx-beta domain-containing protein [Solirubrobacter deserti]MBE2319619.1 PD40 domain-containing protein [Solirubrobacter deserti]MDA0137642.1 PD40 domain-containing protein [Solirubrobacter deserti]
MAKLLRSLAAGLVLAALIPAVAHGAARPGPLIYATDGGQLVSLPPTPNATPFPILETGAYKHATPDVSPDGKTVLFVASDYRIARIPIAGGEPETLYRPTGDVSYTDTPVWRPDGKAYAFVRFTGTRHEIVVRTLSNEQSEIPFPSGGYGARLAWNPNGAELAVSWTQGSDERMSLVDVDSGVFSPLRPQDQSNQYITNTDPDFSPDGKSVVFRQFEYRPETTDGIYRIRTMPVEAGGLPDRVVAATQGEYPRGPVFSPDGKRIAYLQSGSRPGEGTPGTDTIVVGVDGSGSTVLQRTYSPESPATAALDWASASEPSSEGRVFFQRGGQIFRVNADGSGETPLAAGDEVSVSADGTRIAYVVDGDVYTATPSGLGTRRVTTTGAQEWYPAMSPDGTKVAFSRVDEFGSWNLWTANADGSGGEQLVAMTGGRNQDAAWSPDGTRIAFASVGRGAPALRIVNADGTDETDLRTPGRYPAWSPDGEQLLYTDAASDYTAQIFATTPSIGGLRRQLTTDPRGARRASFAPDGSAFVYQSDGGGLFKAFVDGTGVTRLTSDSDQEPAWGPLPQPPKATLAHLTVGEGASATATVTLNKVSEEDAVVRVVSTPGTATADDFPAIDREVTVPAGQLTATFTVATTQDTTDEPDETFQLALTAVSNATAGPAATVTVTDDDAPPALTVTDVGMDEGDLGFTDATFTVRLSAPSGWTVIARAATVNGTAAAPGDFTAVDQTLVFEPGEIVKEVRVRVFGDTQREPDEAFELAFDQLEHVTGPARAARGTLRNDDTDGELPDTRIERGPDGLGNEPAPTFTFIGSVPNGSFECRIDGGAWYACTTPHRTRTVIDGEHRFEVRALDGALVDPEPARRTFTVDTAAPSTMIVSGPNALTSDRNPVFVLASDDGDATFECRLDSNDWGPCAPYANLADGAYRFAARARDRAGNVDDTPATRAFTIDTLAPDTVFTATLASAPVPPAGMGTSTFAVSATGVASMGVSCPADAPSACEGQLAIDRESGRAMAAAAIPLASTRYSVAPGQTKQVAVTLPDAARWVIEREGKMAAVVRLEPRRGTATRRPVTFRASANQPRFLDAGLDVKVSKGVAKLRVRCAKPCKGTLTVSVKGKRVGKAAIRNGAVKVRVSKRGTAVVKFKTKRVPVTLISGGNR